MSRNILAPYWTCPICGQGKSWLVGAEDHAVHHPENELPQLKAAYAQLGLEFIN